jgi:hypothetical protein
MIPKYAKKPKPVEIQDLRKFIAPFGQDVAVLMTWNWQNNITNMITAGSDQLYAHHAAKARELFEKALGFQPGGKLTGDLRHEHLKGPAQTEQEGAVVSLTHEDLGFLIWLLGRVDSEKDSLDKKHQEYMSKYHDRLFPIFGRAFEAVSKVGKNSSKKA